MTKNKQCFVIFPEGQTLICDINLYIMKRRQIDSLMFLAFFWTIKKETILLAVTACPIKLIKKAYVLEH